MKIKYLWEDIQLFVDDTAADILFIWRGIFTWLLAIAPFIVVPILIMWALTKYG